MHASFYPEDAYVLQEALAILRARGYQVPDHISSLDELYQTEVDPPSLLYLGRSLQRDGVPAFEVTYRGRVFFRYDPRFGFENLIPNSDPDYGAATRHAQELVLRTAPRTVTNPIVHPAPCVNPYVDDGRGRLSYLENGQVYCFSYLERGQLLANRTNPYTGQPLDAQFLELLSQTPPCETVTQLSHLTWTWLREWNHESRRVPTEVQRDLQSYRPCTPIWLCRSFTYTGDPDDVSLTPGQELTFDLPGLTTWSTDDRLCLQAYRMSGSRNFVLELLALPHEILVDLSQVAELDQEGVILLPGSYRVRVRQEGGVTAELDPEDVIAAELDAYARMSSAGNNRD